jgi:hypothetical protein
MADRFQITCIDKSDRLNPHEAIANVGGGSGANRWKISQQRAIQGIENREWLFFVNQGGREVDVIVALSPWGNKCLKTRADREHENNLLSLNSCPL